MATPPSTDFIVHASPHDRRLSPNDSERVPLLRVDSDNTRARRPPPFVLSTPTKFCLLLCFLVELSNNILTVPLIALFERAICEHYYRTHTRHVSGHQSSVNEENCKIASVQAQLATLRGWKAFFDTTSGMSCGILLLGFHIKTEST